MKNYLLIALFVLNLIMSIIIFRNNSKSSLKKQFLVNLISILSLGVIIVSFVYSNNEQLKEESENVATTQQEVSIKAIPDDIKLTYTPVVLDEKTEFTKKDALNTLITILKDVQSSVKDNMSIEDVFNLISSGEKQPNEIVGDEVLARYHLADFMKDDRAYQTTTLALLGFIQGLEIYNNKEIHAIENAEEFIYIDDVSKSAYIPLDIFTGRAGAVSFEMVYDGTQWKFAPYSFLQSVQLSSSLQQSQLPTNETQENQ